jgi:hypothetical protein
MRISSSLLARKPTELLRFRNPELRTQTIATHKAYRSDRDYYRLTGIQKHDAEGPPILRPDRNLPLRRLYRPSERSMLTARTLDRIKLGQTCTPEAWGSD